jgi:photosystem II stability/assembly factor-like uncharacterized protein
MCGVIVSKTDPSHLLAFTILVNYAQGSRQADTTSQLGILESKDAGKTWSALHTIPAGYDAVTIAFYSSANPKNIYVTPFSMPPSPTKGFFSTDFGQSWTASKNMTYVGYDPYDPTGRHALGFSNEQSPGAAAQLYVTNDAGKTWFPLVKLPAEITDFTVHKTLVSNMQWDPKDPHTLYLSAASAYVWKSSDDGKTWKVLLSLNKIP